MRERIAKAGMILALVVGLPGLAMAQGKSAADEQLLRKLEYQLKVCEIDHSSMEPYKVSYRDYARETPGSFESFGWLTFLYKSGVRAPIDAKTAETLVFLRLASGSTRGTCASVDTGLAAARAPVKPGAACSAMQGLIACLAKVEGIHRSHIGKKNVYKDTYDATTAVYDPTQIYKRK